MLSVRTHLSAEAILGIELKAFSTENFIHREKNDRKRKDLRFGA